MTWLVYVFLRKSLRRVSKKVGNLYDLVRITGVACMEAGVERFGENREGIRHTSEGQFDDGVDLDGSGTSAATPQVPKD